MRIGYFDCFSGAAGDMIVAALVDAGCSFEALSDALHTLELPGVAWHMHSVRRGGFAAKHLQVEIAPGSQPHHRHLPDILALIERAKLPGRAAERSAAVFQRLAEAEAAAHGTDLKKVHFHEVGAADAIVDIVGACVGIELLGLERLEASPIPTGSGTVTCEHGILPVPAPATAHLLRGVPLAANEAPGELTTPTGAALLTTFCTRFGPLPEMRLTAVGCGAGSREGRTRPNILRLLVGDATAPDAAESDEVIVLEAQLDDAPGQVVAFSCERLLEAGALDAYIVPIIMKKGRPGQLVTVLCAPADAEALERILLHETTTLGVRRYAARRSKLARECESVETRYGPIRVKVGRRGGEAVQVWPEYEDCAAAARRTGAALRTIQQEALRAWTAAHDAR